MKKIIFISLLSLLLLTTSCKNKNSSSVTNTKPAEAYPNFILSLSPSFTEILYAIDAQNQIAAVSEYCDYPPEAGSKPVVGGFDGKTLSIEKLLSYKPDLVCITDGMHNFLIEPLTQYNIPYFLSTANSIEQVKNEILELGKITGHSDKAVSLVNEMSKKINNSIAKTNHSLTVYYEIWNSPYISAGSQSFINDVIKTAGGINLFQNINEAYPIVSEESIIAGNPDIILIPQSSGISIDDIKKRAGWNSINAVNNHIYIVDDNLFSRPGPRITECVEILANYLKDADAL